MGNFNSPCRGQALIELTIGLVTSILVVALGLQLIQTLLKGFKHDYVEGVNQPFQPPLRAKQDLKVKLDRGLIFLNERSPLKNKKFLTEQGWKTEKSFPVSVPLRQTATSLAPQQLFLMKKNNEEMLLINNIGVVTCIHDCS